MALQSQVRGWTVCCPEVPSKLISSVISHVFLYEALSQRSLIQGFTRPDTFVRLFSCLLSVYAQLSAAELQQEEKEQDLKHSHVPPISYVLHPLPWYFTGKKEEMTINFLV